MTLKSMTGFGRSEGALGDASWTWEIRAVNGKGLDLRLRIPNALERIESAVRKAANTELSRGNIQINLSFKDADRKSGLTVNEDVLDHVLFAIGTIKAKTDVKDVSAADILNMRGVMEYLEPTRTDEEKQRLDEQLLDSLGDALSSLNSHRAAEGEALATILLGHINLIENLTTQAEADPARTKQAILERLQMQVAAILETHALERDRLYQEVVLLATKADIREELDRLNAHVASAKALIEEGSPVGRKLEFLAQEFNRECNTLCSKSNAVSLTEIGLELKVVIDQFREQILNVE